MTAINTKTDGYYAAVDGLRAVAVAAVLLYHHDSSWLPGGYLGVEIFFVISGFIITTQLCRSWDKSARIGYWAFVARRCFRLLPGTVGMIVASWLLIAAAWPEELEQLRADTLPGLAFVGNWWLIFNKLSYFEAMGRPRLLQHLWSLGVEFQFYLMWPLICAVLFRISKRVLPALIVLLAALSYLWMASLALGPESSDNSRAYLGTDSRIGAILLGAALAVGLRSWPKVTAILASPGLATAALAVLFIFLWSVDETSSLLYQGGFALVASLSAIVIGGSFFAPHRWIGRFLGSRLLSVLGTRAYSLYLWHWPVFCLTQPYVDVPVEGGWLLSLRLVITVALSEISYRVIEMPFRDARVQTGLRNMWSDVLLRPGLVASGALYGGLACILGIALFNPASIADTARAGQNVSPEAVPLEAPVPKTAQSDTHRLEQTVGKRTDGSHEAELAEAAVVPPTRSTMTSMAGADNALDSSSTLASAQASGTLIGVTSASAPATAAMDPINIAEHGAGNVEATVTRSVPLESADPAVGTDTTRTENPGESAGQATSESAAGNGRPAARKGCLAGDARSHPPFAVQHSERYIMRIHPADVTKRSVLAIGDSVMLGAVDALVDAVGDIDIDAKVSRQLSEAVPLIMERQKKGVLSDLVVIHLGNNGPFRKDELEKVMEALLGVPHIVFINLKLPRTYERKNNDLLANVADGQRVTLVDWREASLGAKKVFGRDGVHLTRAGAQLYAEMLGKGICAGD